MSPSSLGIPPLSKAWRVARTVLHAIRIIIGVFPVFAKGYLEGERSNSVVVFATSRTEFRMQVR